MSEKFSKKIIKESSYKVSKEIVKLLEDWDVEHDFKDHKPYKPDVDHTGGERSHSRESSICIDHTGENCKDNDTLKEGIDPQEGQLEYGLLIGLDEHGYPCIDGEEQYRVLMDPSIIKQQPDEVLRCEVYYNTGVGDGLRIEYEGGEIYFEQLFPPAKAYVEKLIDEEGGNDPFDDEYPGDSMFGPGA